MEGQWIMGTGKFHGGKKSSVHDMALEELDIPKINFSFYSTPLTKMAIKWVVDLHMQSTAWREAGAQPAWLNGLSMDL